jgi:hypothetical protein
MKRHRNARGYALPFVLLVIGILGVMLVAFNQTLVNMKSQIKVTFGQVQAHYMAQSGMQHAMLKLKLLPNEAYVAGSLARGICPFGPASPSGVGSLDKCLLDTFKEDICCDPRLYPVSFNDPNVSQNTYSAKSITALAAEVQNSVQAEVLEIQIEGTAILNLAGDNTPRTETISRLLQIKRSVN